MALLNIIPVLIIILFYLALLFGIFYLIYRWVTKFLFLKQEHNELLKEIVKKMDNR